VTVDDLIAVFEKARAEAAPFPQHHEDGLYAGIAAVVRALRDEFLQSPALEDEGMVTVVDDIFDQILGDAVEKVAGGLPDDAVPIPLMHPESAISAPATELCEDCPRIGHSTDETRCTPCPRRKATDTMPPLYKMLEMPAAAPAVCVWAYDVRTDPWPWRSSCGNGWRDSKRTCPQCKKQVKFTEANHG